MALTQSATGRLGNASVNGVAIGITGWNCTIHKEFADATDSNNYDASTGQLWGSQAPGVLGADATIEGNFDLAGSTDTNFLQKFKSDGPYAMILKITPTITYISGNWDFSDVQTTVSVPGATMINFTANAKSNNIMTIP